MVWQKIKGNFDITFFGIPFLLFVSKSVLMPENKRQTAAIVYSLHITPCFAVGVTVQKRVPKFTADKK